MSKVLIVILAVICLAPVYFLVIGSLTDAVGLFIMPPRVIPRNPSLDNYGYFLGLSIGRWAMNSGVVAVATAVLSVTVSCATGYAFAFFRFPGKRWLWLLLLAGVMVPRMSMMIPSFIVLRKLGILNTLFGLVISRTLSPMGMYLARAYFETVPMSLLDAARIDGASDFQALTRVVVPISKPIVTCLALFAGTGALGDYVWQTLLLQRAEKHTLLIGLLRSVADDKIVGSPELMVNQLGRELAASMLLLIPLLLIFSVASRYFVSALGGALKE